MHNPPFISIITVCYNAEETIERTLQSVSLQSSSNYEYIIIDGKSKDGTLEIIEQYASFVSLLVSEPDKGLYDAMNKAIKYATGDYLCFLNAGDKFHSCDTLKLLINQVKELKVKPDVIYGETAIVDNKGEFIRMRRHSTPKQLTWKSFKKGMVICHQAFLPLRTLAPFYDLNYRYSADFDWCIQILKQSNFMFDTKDTLIDYLNQGLTTANHKASLIERFKIMTHHYGLISTLINHIKFTIRALVKQ